MLAQTLIVASAAIVLLLGSLHLLYTFFSNKFVPRDAALTAHMQRVSPAITRQTTLWRAWVGFNASHSLGAMLFGTVYGYLGLLHLPMLLDAPLLLAIGLLFLAAMLVLAQRYWFRIPLVGIGLALLLFAIGTALLLA